MEEKQKLTNEQLEAELNGRRSKATFAKIVTYVAAVATILFFGMDWIPVGILGLLVTLVAGYQMAKQTEALKKTLSSNVVGDVLGEVFDNVEYNPFGRLSDERIRSAGMVFPFPFESVRGSDHIKAVYKGLNLELSDVELYHATDSYNEERGEWEQSEEKVFQGQWLVCDFGKTLSGEVHLSENTKALRKQHKSDCIKMENPAFNDRILVTAENAQEAYYVLTPHMMEYILAAAGKSGGEVYMSFLRGGRLHIAVKTGRDFFELGKSRADVASLRQKFRGELRWFTDIVDELRLEEHLYKKEASV